MKLFPHRLIVSSAVLLALFTTAAEAAPKGKGKPLLPPAVATPDAANPIEALAPYINSLEKLLALERDVPPVRVGFFNQAPGRIVTLKASFAEQREKATETDRSKFDAAIATCDTLTGALNERAAVLGNLNASAAVAGSGKLEKGPRKDNLTQGIKGGSVAKAVGSVVERDRERSENRQAKVAAGRSDTALTAMTANNWTKRSGELRKQITDAYARIK